MKLKDIAARFSKLQLKERRLIMIASVGGLLLLGYSLAIDPVQQKAAVQRNLLAQQQAELSSLQTQLVGLRQQAANPDAALRKELEDTLKHVAGIETELRAFDHLLVSPAQMPQLLYSLLAKHRGLELVRLKTLPATPLLTTTEASPQNAPPATQAQPASTGTKPLPPPGGIYRHAIEITIAGSYADLTRYAEELQRISPRPLWSTMQLKVVEYPRSELTFTLYTLSLDLPWLAV
jgi:MSHA biogenesis protein MshJ